LEKINLFERHYRFDFLVTQDLLICFWGFWERFK